MSLSDDIIPFSKNDDCLLTGKVKAFIKELKISIEECDVEGRGLVLKNSILEGLDSLAGEDLIE